MQKGLRFFQLFDDGLGQTDLVSLLAASFFKKPLTNLLRFDRMYNDRYPKKRLSGNQYSFSAFSESCQRVRDSSANSTNSFREL